MIDVFEILYKFNEIVFIEQREIRGSFCSLNDIIMDSLGLFCVRDRRVYVSLEKH